MYMYAQSNLNLKFPYGEMSTFWFTKTTNYRNKNTASGHYNKKPHLLY